MTVKLPINISDLLTRRRVESERIERNELMVLSFPGPDRSIALADLQAGKAVSIIVLN